MISQSNMLGDKCPRQVVLEHNGVSVRLHRDQSRDLLRWVGVPTNMPGNGRHGVCRYPILFYPDGYVAGTGALNFFASQGRSDKKTVAFSKRVAVRDHLKVLFVSSVLQSEENTSANLLLQDLEEGTGFTVEHEPSSPQDVIDYAFSGRPGRYLRLARQHGYRFNIDIPKLISEAISTKYAVAARGKWDEMSDEVADTSNLYLGKILLMRSKGYRLVLAKDHRPRR